MCIVELSQHLRALRDDKISSKDGLLLSPENVHRGLATSSVGRIDDIVVNQTGSVDHFDDMRHPFL